MSGPPGEEYDRPQHTVRLVIDEGIYPHVVCPFDPADTARPCWPHTEFGEPYPLEKGTSDGCVYKEWVGEEGIDAFHGVTEITVTLAAAVWKGDHFEFLLGEPVPAHNGDQWDGTVGNWDAVRMRREDPQSVDKSDTSQAHSAEGQA